MPEQVLARRGDIPTSASSEAKVRRSVCSGARSVVRRAAQAAGRRTAPAARQPQPAAPPDVADHRDEGLREVRAAGRWERIPPVAVENEEQVPGRCVPA
jgi:hypothetical protein